MADVVVTVPKARWAAWIEEGDLPGEEWTGDGYAYSGYGACPNIEPGERVYIVAHGKLRGYAPLTVLSQYGSRGQRWDLIREGGAVAVTIDKPIPGFRGWRYRWWSRDEERPFPDWAQTGQGVLV